MAKKQNKNVIDRIDNHFDRLDASIDKLDSRLDSVDVTLAKQHGQLVEHIKRSEANEKAIDILKAELKPVATFVDRSLFLFKCVLSLGGLAVAYKIVAEILGYVF